MPVRREVLYSNKSSGGSPHERILFIGGKNFEGRVWKVSQQQAIIAIESGTWEYFVQKEGKADKLITAVNGTGHKYIKTETDTEQPDNLLNLPDCPA